MKRKLSELSLEELFHLFPIELREPDSIWKEIFLEKKKELEELLPYEDIKIWHIGSTAIKGIWAKPIVDILIEVPDSIKLETIEKILNDHDFITMSKTEKRISLNFGYTIDGFADKVFHIHLRRITDHDELYFRDLLIKDPKIAKAYEKLKLDLWKEYEFDRDAYTEAKSEFVNKYTKLAKRLFNSKYES